MTVRAHPIRQALAVLVLSMVVGVRPAAAAPDVVVSIAPVHSLVAAIMEGVGEPKLLLPARASPHAYTLRPSDARAIATADVIFRVGTDLETFLDKPLAALAAGQAIALIDQPGIRQQELADDGAEDHGHGDHSHARDPHIWLAIANARQIGEIAAIALARADPVNAAAYEANLARLTTRLDVLEDELRSLLAPVRNVPYVVMHDAYSHFEAEYGLRRVAAIALSPERQPGARRLRAIRDLLAAQDVRCVFAEPQFPATLGATVVDGTNSRLTNLDPVGVDIAPGPELYFTLMDKLGRSLAECLRADWPR